MVRFRGQTTSLLLVALIDCCCNLYAYVVPHQCGEGFRYSGSIAIRTQLLYLRPLKNCGDASIKRYSGLRPQQIKATTCNNVARSSSSCLLLTHGDITWKLRPEEGISFRRRLAWKISGKLIRLQCRLHGRPPPRLLFPLSGQAVLEAYCGRRKVGRFGIVTQAGPSTPELVDTVRAVYGDEDCEFVRAAAIKYMFVEPEYRGRLVGRLALEAIAFMHAAKDCDHTLLVANDKSDDQRLVQWYEHAGFSRAPALQDVLGSPDGIYGITMIAPTRQSIPDDCVIQWW